MGSGAWEGGLHLGCVVVISGHSAGAKKLWITPVDITGIVRRKNVLSTLNWQRIVSFRGRDKLVAIVPCAFLTDAADLVEMGIKVGRKALGLTTL